MQNKNKMYITEKPNLKKMLIFNKTIFVLVIAFLKGKFGINLPSSHF